MKSFESFYPEKEYIAYSINLSAPQVLFYAPIVRLRNILRRRHLLTGLYPQPQLAVHDHLFFLYALLIGLRPMLMMQAFG